MMQPRMMNAAFELQWHALDPERRLGLPGSRFTRVNPWLSALLGTLVAILFYVALLAAPDSTAAIMFTQRGWTPYAIVLLTAWSGVILWFKWRKLQVQRRALAIQVIPADPSFVISPFNVQDVIGSVHQLVDEPRQFSLFHRILIALGNLRNLGRVSDVDDILRSQAETDESMMDTSYALVRGFVWAIPVLGFIGTVSGLSQSIGGFGGVLSSAQEVSEITQALQGVTAGLSTAFETTLEALVAALVIQLLATLLRKGEEEFLDDCADYCQQHIVNRLRVNVYEAVAE